jgi:hypothetical protein
MLGGNHNANGGNGGTGGNANGPGTQGQPGGNGYCGIGEYRRELAAHTPHAPGRTIYF